MANSKIKSEAGLTVNQEKFCQLFCSYDNKDLFGNGVQSYLEVYNIDRTKPNWYKTACAQASKLLSNAKVCERINKLLEGQGLNDMNVDKQLGFLLNQHADYKVKLGAIKEYNVLKERIKNSQTVLIPQLEQLESTLKSLAESR